jgi:cytochrome c oxidase subunit 2
VIAATPPLTEQAVELDRIWTLFLWIGGGVGLLVAAVLSWILFTYRRSRQRSLPRQRQYQIPLEVAYTVVPLVIVAGLFAVTVGSIHSVDRSERVPDVVVDVTAFQWQWQFDYPDLGARSVATDDANPDLVLPQGAIVEFRLTSLDVLHSFWIPGFRYKRDIFPGETATFQVTVGDTLGSFPNSGICAEFCGYDHHKMKFDVDVVTPDEFTSWVAANQGSDTTAEATT